MKEAVGESAMTLITIALIAGVLGALAIIISTLLGNQSKRANCENAGGQYSSGTCKDYNGNVCELTDGEYICG